MADTEICDEGSPNGTDGGRAAEDETLRSHGTVTVHLEIWEMDQETLDRDRSLQTRQVNTQTGVRAPRKRHVLAGVGTPDVELIRVGKEVWVPVGCAEGHSD